MNKDTHTAVFLLYFIIHQWMAPNLGTLQYLVLDTRKTTSGKIHVWTERAQFTPKQKANLK